MNRSIRASVRTTTGNGLRTITAVLLATSFACATAHAQQAYPSQPVRLVVPFPPGGSNDIIARALAHRLTEPLGKPVVVENKAGAGGVIGSEFVARAAPDGHTLLFSSSTFSVTAAVRKLPYDPIGEFTAVASIGRGPMMIVVHPTIPAQTIN